MFSFRQKILISYLLVFLIFLGLLFPFTSQSIRKIVTKAMTDRADELIVRVRSANSEEALIRKLRAQQPYVFFRVSLVDEERQLLYDSHARRLLGPQVAQEYVVDFPEVLEAFETGSGYSEYFSDLIGQEFSHFARAFTFHDRTYVLRIAFPFRYIQELTRDFNIGFLTLGSLVLFFFSIMTWMIINHLSGPIQQIIDAIRPYQEAKTDHLPEIRLRATPGDGDFTRLASTLNELSTRVKEQINRIRQERNDKTTILESLVEGVIAVDEKFVVRFANPSALSMLGLREGELVGHHILETRQDTCFELLRRSLEDNAMLTENLRLKRGGTKLYLDLVAVPKGDGGVILVLQDNSTHHKLIEMRKDFVANASHELKTPITIIRGFAETLHDNPDLPKETAVEITAKIVRNCERMNNLVRDLLALADIENLPPSRLHTCNLMNILESSQQTVLSVHGDATIELHDQVGEPLQITADPALLEQAFTNLMDNGCKYSQGPGHVTVTIRAQDRDHLSIAIKDRGIGIPQEDLEHIFTRFYRVEKSRSQKSGGTGLGLSIVETIIEKHYGRISVESEPGHGTTFTVVLRRHFPQEGS